MPTKFVADQTQKGASARGDRLLSEFLLPDFSGASKSAITLVSGEIYN
ncbi:MAG: hypothetical protein JWP78_2405 [Mucilaginibacter sp.]|nr:hypothetical protein [Mucilaginibacter sp.]